MAIQDDMKTPIQRKADTSATSFKGQGISPNYARRGQQMTGNSAPSFSAPGFKGKGKKARIHSQRSKYDRERRLAGDKKEITGMQQAGQTGRVAMREAGAGQRQRSSFVQALQEQQNRFGQQDQMQQNRFGQQNAQQQNRFGQRNQEQQNRFGQQNQLEQTKQEGKRRQSALDYRLSGGDVAGTAAIANGMPDYENIQPLETQNKVGTIRTYETDSGGQQRYDSRTGRDYYPFSPVPLGERLTPRP